jgi:hypothetical protein
VSTPRLHQTSAQTMTSPDAHTCQHEEDAEARETHVAVDEAGVLQCIKVWQLSQAMARTSACAGARQHHSLAVMLPSVPLA